MTGPGAPSRSRDRPDGVGMVPKSGRAVVLPREPLFLERQTYRRRRLMDGARMLPVLGALLFMFPLLWLAGGGGARTANGGLYIFAVWTLLIVGAAVMSRRLIREDRPSDADTRNGPAQTDLPTGDPGGSRVDAPTGPSRGDPGP